MKILLIHADHFKYEVKSKALKEPEEITPERRHHEVAEALVVFCAVEKSDENDPDRIIEKTVATIVETASKVKTDSLVLYPYAHLSSALASPAAAVVILEGLERRLKAEGCKVIRAPFGWYKSFDISCKGHPLSELSRVILLEKEAAAEVAVTPVEEVVYKVLTPEMKLYDPEEYSFKPGEEEFKILVEKEALKRGLTGGEPHYLNYCKKFGVSWEHFSDVGHMRYGPEASLIFELISDYAGMLVDSLDIPVYKVRGTNMFDLSIPAVKEHAKLFGGRLYSLETDSRELVLRYAACHQQFAMIKDWVISYRNLPMGAYELADSYRLEQEGELLLCFRVRKLHMPDLHIFCRGLEEAEEFSFKVHRKIYSEIASIGRDYVSLYNTTRSYFDGHQEFFRRLLEVEQKPVLLCFVPEKYYWVLNVEYNIIDELKRPREIATFQIDVGNSERFGINYIDEKGTKVPPVIIHTALIGTVERYLYTIFDSATQAEKAGRPPMLPVWLSPTQARIIPVSQRHTEVAMTIVQEMEKAGIRADLDDRDETLGKKVREAEKAWIPYVVVVGEEEIKTGIVDVRVRKFKTRRKTPLKDLIAEVKKEGEVYPWRPLPLPNITSQRPVY